MKNFNDIYEEIYKGSGQELMRLKHKSNIRNLIILAVIGVFVVLFFIFRNPYLFIPIGIGFVILVVCMFINYDEYREKYKDFIIKRFVKSYSDKLEYYPKQGISPGEYRKADFDGYFDRYTSEDLIEGTILENSKIEIAEVHTEREETTTDSDGNTTTEYHTLFHGIFAAIKLDTSNLLSFKITRNSLFSDMFKGKRKLDMDSREFEKIYDVATDDKIGTLRVMTSDVMEMLIDFKEKNKVIPEIALKNDVLYIRFEVGNVYEPNFIKNDVDYDSLKKIYNMIKFIFDLAEDFSKNIIEYEE